MGRMASAPSPISVRKTLSTVAKIGRSMKLWVTESSCFSLRFILLLENSW